MSEFNPVGFVKLTSTGVSYMQKEAIKNLKKYLEDREKFFQVMEKLSYEECTVCKHSFLGIEWGKKHLKRYKIYTGQQSWFRKYAKDKRVKYLKDMKVLELLDTSGVSSSVYVSLEAKQVLDKWFNYKEESFQEWYDDFRSFSRYIYYIVYPTLQEAIEEYKK
ncbi:hypothetical protein Herod_00041 [Acinetobacter phage Herod]|nr:hypothetical protein Herod_00041 [Acinetobacter phage Herod]